MLNDNETTVNNSPKIESTLNKNHSSTTYRLVRQNVAAGVVKIEWILTAHNISDALKKGLTEAKRKKLFSDRTY